MLIAVISTEGAMIVDEENGSEFEAITMDGGPFDSLTITRLEDGGIKLSIDRDAIVWKQHVEGTMCAEDVARLAEWLTPTRDNALAAMTQRAEQAEAKLAHALGADKPDKPATPTERARHWAIVASEEKRRAETAEAKLTEYEDLVCQRDAATQRAVAKLAAVPLTSLLYCWYADTAEREEDEWERHSNIVDDWLTQFSKEAQP